MPKAQIAAISSFLPEHRVELAPLIDKLNLSADELANLPCAGVKEKRLAFGYSAKQMAVNAGKKLFEETGENPEDIDILIAIAQIPDNLGTGIAVGVLEELGTKNAMVMDLFSGCPSYLIALNTARAYIEAGLAKKVLITTGVTVNSRFNPDFLAQPVGLSQGDAGSATLVVAGESGILSSAFQSNGQAYGFMGLRPLGGSLEEYWKSPEGIHFFLPPKKEAEHLVFHMLKTIPKLAKKSLAEVNLSPADVDLLVTHQVTMFFTTEFRQRLGITEESRVHDTFEWLGAALSSGIPITIRDAVDKGKLKRGDLLQLVGFLGAGEVMASLTIRY